jgi:Ankyrin repeats (3 copies)/Ankyrin repeats (many copies)
MPGSDNRLVGVVVGAIAILLAGCSMAPQQRDSLADVPFKTTELEHLMATVSARDHLPRFASPLDLELMRAAGLGIASEVSALLARGAVADAVDPSRTTALLVASREGHREVVRLLLASGADVNGRGGAMTPLSATVLRGHIQVAALLLRHGADVNAGGVGGLPALMNAVKINRIDIAALLLAAEPDLGIYDHDGNSLVAVATANKNAAMVYMLVHSGAPKDLPVRGRWNIPAPYEPPPRPFDFSLLQPAQVLAGQDAVGTAGNGEAGTRGS